MSAISIPDLSDVSIPENMDELIQQVFPNLTDEQATASSSSSATTSILAKAQARSPRRATSTRRT